MEVKVCEWAQFDDSAVYKNMFWYFVFHYILSELKKVARRERKKNQNFGIVIGIFISYIFEDEVF